MCEQNRESRQGIREWRQDEVGWSSDKGSRWQGWAASGMTKWFLTLTNCARTTRRSRPGGCCGHCSQEATDSQEVEEEMGQCQSPFAGLTTFTGADTARATLACTKQVIWEKQDLWQWGIRSSVPRGVSEDGQRHCRHFLDQWEEAVGQQGSFKFHLQSYNGKELRDPQLLVFRYHSLYWGNTFSYRDNLLQPQSLPLSDGRDL